MNKVDRGIARSQRLLYSHIHPGRVTKVHLNVLCAVGTPSMPKCIRTAIYRLVRDRETGYECSIHINYLLWVSVFLSTSTWKLWIVLKSLLFSFVLRQGLQCSPGFPYVKVLLVPHILEFTGTKHMATTNNTKIFSLCQSQSRRLTLMTSS